MTYDFLIIGAGFAGSVCAERLAHSGKKVLLIDKRDHVGGNAFDRTDAYGVLIHPYGPHIFHTNSEKIFRYLSMFTDWRFYEHRVRAEVNGALYPIPINRTTINSLYRMDLSESQVKSYLDSVRIQKKALLTSEDVVLSSVGIDLCEKFFRGYTRKQWAMDLSELSAGVAARIPTRTNDDDRYFSDTFQFMPSNGYTALFKRMLDNPLIEVRTSTSFSEIKDVSRYERLIYTGPIDAFFDFRFGPLPYRSLHFDHRHLPDVDKYQETGTINYPNDYLYTRITEFRHITGQSHSGTSIVLEYPTDKGDPYYPIPTKQNELLYKRYEGLTDELSHVTFVGRLAQYRYYNMDQVVGAALATAGKLLA